MNKTDIQTLKDLVECSSEIEEFQEGWGDIHKKGKELLNKLESKGQEPNAIELTEDQVMDEVEKAFKEAGSNAYFGHGFLAGYELGRDNPKRK